MNILFLLCNDENEDYPSFLAGINGKPLIQWKIEAAQAIPNANLIFVITADQDKKYFLSNAISLLVPDSSIIVISELTKGPACSALMAIQHINDSTPLLILDSNDLVKLNFNEAISEFENQSLDAGVIIFNSLQPQYAFLKLDPSTNFVIEASEKKPISQNASAGIYYFKQGIGFIQAVKSMIKKGASIEGCFYLGPTLNELILNQSKIGTIKIKDEQYISLRTHNPNFFESTV